MNKSKLSEWEKLEQVIGEIPDFDSMSGQEEEAWAKKANLKLAQNRKAILEEVRSKVKFTKSEIDLLLNLIADNEKEGSYYGNKRIYWANRYKIKQKLSLLEGEK